MLRSVRRGPATAALLVLLAGCTSTASQGTIVVPGAAAPGSEPSGSVAGQASTHHIHSLLLMGQGVIVATHTGVEVRLPGSPSPRPSSGVSGDVLQLAAGPGGLVYAAGHNLGVLVSRDQGASFASVSPDVAGFDVHGLASDPRDRHHLVAYAVGHGLLRSDDAGAHWAHEVSPDADRKDIYLTGLVITADGTLLAGSPQAGVTAMNKDNSFVPVYQGSGRVYSIAAAATDANIVVVVGERGLFITANGGKTWSSGQPSEALTGIAVDPTDATHFLAGSVDGNVFTSGDSGSTWSGF
ncbi:MAG: WD40/YVTN/BNR-like repeat-containing protein [Candidatus Dormibacteria bacterium]